MGIFVLGMVMIFVLKESMNEEAVETPATSSYPILYTTHTWLESNL
jgi:hypothetical protein